MSERRTLLGLAATTTLALAACGGEGPADELLVLHSANAYGYFDDCGCAADSTGGLAKRAWVVDSLRRESDAPVLLVDAGDYTGGENAYGAALGRVMMDAMELMEYDAMTLGEWDLNQGTAYVRDIVGGEVAWVHTNYDVVGLEEAGHETLILEKGGRRIGLIGLLNPTITLNPAVRDSVVVEEDIVGSARRGVAALREKGADAVIVLSHLSYRADRALAQEVEGIDLIVSGHGGKSLTEAEQVIPGTWIVAPGDLGRFLGRATVALEARGEGSVEVADVTGDLIVLDPTIPNDLRLRPLFDRYEQEREALLERELDARRAPRYFRAPGSAPGESPLEGRSPGAASERPTSADSSPSR
ncbi:MAG: hypothetical protein R3326_03915 [Gemmatimonadota bacterium]|nr:hypothetical protein [Gemmatimonadota bacterium]